MSREDLPGDPFAWRIVLGSALGVGVSCSSVVFLSFGVFLKPLVAEFGWDRAQVSMAMTFATLITAAATPALGGLVDRFGPRRVLFPSIFAYALLLACLGAVGGELWHFYLLFGAIALAGVGSSSVTYTRVITSWFDERRGLALGLSMSGVGLAAAAIPPLAQWMISRVGWRGAYVGFAAIVLAVTPIIALWLEERRSLPSGPQTQGASSDAEADVLEGVGLAVSEARRSRIFWTLGLAFFLAALGIHGVMVHFVPLLTDRGVPAASAAGAAAMLGFGMLVGRIGSGYLMDRFFAPWVAAACFALGPLLGIWLLAEEVGRAGVCAFLIGLGAGAEVDAIALLTSRYFGLRHFGSIYGYFYAAFMLGTGLGPAAVGVGFEGTGSYTTPLFLAAGAVALLCVALLTLGPFPDWSKKSQPPDGGSGSAARQKLQDSSGSKVRS